LHIPDPPSILRLPFACTTSSSSLVPREFVSRYGNKVFRRIQKCLEPPRSCHYSCAKVRVIHHTALGCIATPVHPHARGRASAHQRLRTKPAANDSSNFRKLLWDARLRHSLQAMAVRASRRCRRALRCRESHSTCAPERSAFVRFHARRESQ